MLYFAIAGFNGAGHAVWLRLPRYGRGWAGNQSGWRFNYHPLTGAAAGRNSLLMKFFSKYDVRPWLTTISLSSAAFIFVTTEMLPVGLLPDIAASMVKSEADTGILLTAYAWMVAIMSLPLTVLSGSLNRRSLVLALLLIFIMGNIFSALAGTFILLMGARICIALAHSVFWSIVTPLAARAAPEGGRARALGIIVSGSSLATVLGVPLGTLLGHYFGWRAAFAAVALTAFGIFLILWRLLPSAPSENSGSFKSLPGILGNRRLLMIYLLNLLAVAGHFTAVTYFSPLMQQLGGFSSQSVALLLLVLGGAGVAGGMLGGKFAERPGRMILFAPLCLLCVMFVLLPQGISMGMPAAAGLCLLWGTAFTFVTLNCQLRVLGLSPKALDVAVAIYSGTFNIGIGGGALMGSRIFASFGIEINAFAAAGFMAVAALMSLLPVIAGSGGKIKAA